MRKIAGSYNKYMFNFIRNCQSVFQSGCIFLYFSQCLRVPVTDPGGESWGVYGCVQMANAGSGAPREEEQGGKGCFSTIRLVCLTIIPCDYTNLGLFLRQSKWPQQILFVASLTKL